MNINKSLVVAATIATIGLGSVAGLGIASAQSGSSAGASGLVDKIATKFNLNKDDVQKVFDEDRTAREVEHQAERSKHLQKLVDSGKITTEQKTLIENKQKELISARDAERAELEAWAKQNNLDLKFVMFGGRHGDRDDSRLQDAVDSGEITADQKTLIETKQKELQTKRESARDALKKWAADNKIDEKYIMMGPGGHGSKGGGGPH